MSKKGKWGLDREINTMCKEFANSIKKVVLKVWEESKGKRAIW